MQSHLAGKAWILRAFLSIWLFAMAGLPVRPVFIPGAAKTSPPMPLDLSGPVVLPEGAANGTALWADYDNDGDLDLLVNGIGSGAQPATLLWKNTAGMLTRVSTTLPNVESASAAWGDYDNDNDLDLLILGQVSFVGGRINGLARIYRNDSGTLTHLTGAVLPPLYRGSGDWGDYDNDGDLDLLLTGYVTGGGALTAIYRNDGGIFTESGIGLPGAGYSQAAWGDYDNDGDLDLALLGLTATGPVARVYNQSYASGPQFTMSLNLPGMWNGTASWVDVENDGDLDLLLTGNTSSGPGSPSTPVTLLLRYNAGTFQEVDTSLPDVWTSSVSLGDYDNDGDVDLALNGLTASEQVTGIYRNDGGSSFTQTLTLPSGYGLSLAWGNFDGDANRILDLAVSGQNQSGTYSTVLYRGQNVPNNQPPAAPTLGAACWDPESDRLLLEWSPASDDHTATAGLTYDLRLGTTDGGTQIMGPAANTHTGFRRSAQPGPLFADQKAMLRGLNLGHYYWAVQAIDTSYAGGLFSAQGEFDYGVETGVNDSAIAFEGNIKSIDVLDNDNQSNGPLRIVSVEDPAHGSAVVSGSNPAIIRYTPDYNFFGIERFYYHAVDQNNNCSRAYVEVTVIPIDPDTPTDINLTPSAVNENQPIGKQVGRLTTEDPDNPYDSHTYRLVSGTGSTDNGMFAIQNDWLVTRVVFDYETRTTYSVRIRSTDNYNKYLDKIFTIHINDTTESAPTILWNGSSADAVTVTVSEDGMNAADQPDPFVLALSANDAESYDLLSWSVVTPAQHGTAQVNPAPTTTGQSKSIYYMPEADSVAPDSFVVQVTDTGGLFDTITVNIQMIPVNDPPRLDPLYDVTFPEWSGPNSIPLIGLAPGSPDETEPLTFTVETDAPHWVTDLEVVNTTPIPEIRFHLRAGVSPASITLTIDDGQPDHNLTQMTFYVYGEPRGPKYYLPMIYRLP